MLMSRRFSFPDEKTLGHWGLARDLETENVGSGIDLQRRPIDAVGKELTVDINAHRDDVDSGRIFDVEDHARLGGFEIIEPARAVLAHDRRTRRNRTLLQMFACSGEASMATS